MEESVLKQVNMHARLPADEERITHSSRGPEPRSHRQNTVHETIHIIKTS